MKAQDIIDKLTKDIRFLTRPVMDDLVTWIDEAQKEIVAYYKWSWLKREVAISAPLGSPTDFVDIALPLNGDGTQDVDYLLWVKNYTKGYELTQVGEQPLSVNSQLPLFYQLLPTTLRLYPGREEIADLRYKYIRKVYDVADEDTELIIPGDYDIVICPKVLEKIYLGVDDARSGEYHNLGLFALIERKRTDIRRNPPRHIQPDPATQF